jgi:hypothetical protein
MARKRGGKPRAASILACELRVMWLALHVSSRAEKRRGEAPSLESGPWLELGGELDSPIRDVRAASIHVHPETEWRPGTIGPPSIGSFIQFRPQISGVVAIPPADFDRIWSMAVSGHLKYVHVAFTEPHRRSSFIVSVSFSSKSEDEEMDQPASVGAVTNRGGRCP